MRRALTIEAPGFDLQHPDQLLVDPRSGALKVTAIVVHEAHGEHDSGSLAGDHNLLCVGHGSCDHIFNDYVRGGGGGGGFGWRDMVIVRQADHHDIHTGIDQPLPIGVRRTTEAFCQCGTPLFGQVGEA